MQSAIGAASLPRALGDGYRYRLALMRVGLSVRALAEKHEINPAHLQRVINGERPATPLVLAILRDAAGETGWAYATGETDVLP